MLYEIKYCCPDCGCNLWHTMQNLSSDEYCCDDCGSVYTLDEMEPHFCEYEREAKQ